MLFQLQWCPTNYLTMGHIFMSKNVGSGPKHGIPWCYHMPCLLEADSFTDEWGGLLESQLWWECGLNDFRVCCGLVGTSLNPPIRTKALTPRAARVLTANGSQLSPLQESWHMRTVLPMVVHSPQCGDTQLFQGHVVLLWMVGDVPMRKMLQ